MGSIHQIKQVLIGENYIVLSIKEKQIFNILEASGELDLDEDGYISEPPLSIKGMTPKDYASIWGHTKSEIGVMFYNFSSERQEKTEAWLTSFAEGIKNFITLCPFDDSNAKKDKSDLHKLYRHVKWLIRKLP